MDKETYSIFTTSTPKRQIRLNSVDNATSGRQRIKSATHQRRFLSEITNKLTNHNIKSLKSPDSSCANVPIITVTPFAELMSTPSSQHSSKRIQKSICSPVKEWEICQTPLRHKNKRILSDIRSPFKEMKSFGSVQSSHKKIKKYCGSPYNKFTIYKDTLDVQSDRSLDCSLSDAVQCSDYEDDVFMNTIDVPNNNETGKNSIVEQFYDSFENDDDEEGPWLPRKLFRDAEELNTLVRGYIEPKIENHNIYLSPIPFPRRSSSVGLFALNISCGPPPSPVTVEIVI